MAVNTKVTIVGAGPCGCLLALYLARRGFEIEVYERRGDLRREVVDIGKSIKLTLVEGGLHALDELGLMEEVMKFCIHLRGRAIHSRDHAVTYITYGDDSKDVIYSFSRYDLNALLLDKAEEHPNVRLFFHQRCVALDKELAKTIFRNEYTGEERRVAADVVIGADGTYSVVRRQMHNGERADFRQDFLRWGYKELSILAKPDGSYAMDKSALHIWIYGDCMLFALPNMDGSFTGVCALPFEGEHSFEAVRTDDDLIHLFEEHFGDALPHMPNLVQEYWSCKTASCSIIRTSRWHYKGKVALVGDAVHTLDPFYGRGMNVGFEDCSILVRCIDRHPGDLEAAFVEYQNLRKPNTDALADILLGQSVSNLPFKGIFISYSHKDKEFVDRLTTKLSLDNIPFWRDNKDILVGEVIDRAVSEGIQNHCLFLVVLTPSSITSRWVARELDEASHEVTERGKIILPVITGGLDLMEVPARVRRFKCADFGRGFEESYLDLLNSIRIHLQRQSVLGKETPTRA